MLLLVASCDSVQRRSTTVDATRRRDARTDSSEQLSESIVQFSNSAAEILADDAISNSYSHQRLLGARKRLGEPLVRLESTDAHSAFASTDCSGWLSFALNTVSPLHEAVLQSQRRRPEHNRAYSADFALRERWRPWSRSFVVTQYLRADYAETTGFEPVTDFEELQPGDIGAYAMGRYAKPSDESRPKPKDTGHVFIVVGPPIVVDRQTEDYDGRGTLSEDAAKVIAVAVVDSSATLHFDPDSRKDEKERYSLPTVLPHSRAKPGGVGAGTIWFALSEEGRVLQRRLGLGQRYRPVLARAARLRGRVSLDETILDDGGALLVKVFENSPSEFGGLSYGDAPIDLTGEGGLRLASGRLVLNGHSDFSGGVTVESGELIVGSSAALGAGDVAIRGGSMILQQPAIATSASLSLADGLPDGALRLDFRGRDVVRSVRIGNTMHRCGTWGGPESRAMFVDPVFSGPGILELAAEPLEACAPTSEESAETDSKRRASSSARANRR
jgi:autotransporter-associated beta strand protein